MPFLFPLPVALPDEDRSVHLPDHTIPPLVRVIVRIRDRAAWNIRDGPGADLGNRFIPPTPADHDRGRRNEVGQVERLLPPIFPPNRQLDSEVVGLGAFPRVEPGETGR